MQLNKAKRMDAKITALTETNFIYLKGFLFKLQSLQC